ncbi:ATP-binding protein [Thauera sinica]|uniref:ATP-binding protein n=1 Tax=Thauera sinica TaxID=2665146 RepID=A0ABW1AUQ3_9RHOO|nr:ATP-binding protein [Thauera sp. K11]ATE59273.1 magnesium chelatase [Thauera sp. K11]
MNDSPHEAAFPPAFPFTALHGQPLLQTALLIATVDPLIGGVLVEGPRGTAKSTAARALAALLPGGRFVNLPLSASEERLVGSLDLEAALQDGQVRFHPGLLARAHEGVLYVDEVNLLADGLVDLLLDVCASGVNRIERDGISHAHPARITLVGTMNAEEGELRPQLLDRFGLFVRLGDTLPPAGREAIVRARLAFDADPAAFAARLEPAQRALAARIAAARTTLPAVDFDDASHQRVAALCHAAAVEGVRADLVMLRAARAHAALDGRTRIEDGDIDAVAELVLAHRRKTDEPPHDTPQAQPQPRSDAAPPPADDAEWGALPPQAVPIQAVKNVRPLHAKKY